MNEIPTSEEDDDEEGDVKCEWGGSEINRSEVRV